MIGLGCGFSYFHTIFKPGVSITFPYSASTYRTGLTLDFTLLKKVNKHFTLQWYVPVTFGALSISRTKVENPALPEKLRSNSTLIGKWFPSYYSMFVGFIYHI